MSLLNRIIRDIHSNIGIIDTYDEQIRVILDNQEYDIEQMKDLETKDELRKCDKDCGNISDEKFQQIMDDNEKLREKLRDMSQNNPNDDEEIQKLRVENVDQFEKILLMQSQLDNIDDSQLEQMKMENESLKNQLESSQKQDSTSCDDITRENENLKEQLLIIKTKNPGNNDKQTENLQDEVKRLNEMIQSSDCLKDLDECKQRLQIFKERNGGKEPIIVDKKSTPAYFDTLRNTGILGLFLSLISEMKAWKDTDIKSENQLYEMIKKKGELDDESMELFISLMRKYGGEDWYNLQKYVSFIPMVSQSENNSNYINRKILETYISNIYSSNPYIENNKESRDAYIKKIYTFSMKQMKARKTMTEKHIDLLVNPTDLKTTIVYEIRYDPEQRKDVSIPVTQNLSTHKDLNTMKDFSLAGTRAINDGPFTLAVIESIRLQIQKENGKAFAEKWSIDNLVTKGVKILESDIWKREKPGKMEFTTEIEGKMETINPYEVHYDMFKNGIDNYMYLGFKPPLQTGNIMEESLIDNSLASIEGTSSSTTTSLRWASGSTTTSIEGTSSSNTKSIKKTNDFNGRNET